MPGVLINALAVFLGSAIGLLAKKGIPEKFSNAAMTAIGLGTLYIGITEAIQGEKTIILILSLVSGALIGTLADIDGKLEKFGDFLKRKIKSKNDKVNLSRGFVTASLLFCTGAMTAVGSLNAGLEGNFKLLYTKSVLDFISSCILAGTLGVGVMLSSLFVLVYQGGLALLAGLLKNILTDATLIAEISCVGGVTIIALGLNILEVTKIKAANLLPALPFVQIGRAHV